MRTRARLGPLLLLAGCGPSAVRLVTVSPASVAQTISLLGDTLYSIPLDGAGGPARVGRLHAAREVLARDSLDVRGWVRLGRSTAAMGRLRDAVELYTGAMALHFRDPRVFRERGEVLLQLRYLDAAIADFRKAGLLAIGKGPLLEPAPGQEIADSAAAEEPGITTLQYQTFFLLGIALYCKGDNVGAYTVLAEAAKVAVDTDELARALLWTFFAVRRVGDGSEGKTVLDLVRAEWGQHSRAPELALLLGYQGVIPTDSIRSRALTARGREQALYSYGLAYSLQLRPGRRVDAELWLERARSGSDWTAVPYLAAESDLARLRGVTTLKVR